MRARCLLIAVGVVCAVALTALAGWIFDVPMLRSVIPGAVEMKANTAVCLLLNGIALLILSRGTASTSRWMAFGVAVAAAAIGLATLAEYAFDLGPGIDELLFRDTANAYNANRGRMSPLTAVAFIALAVGFVAVPRAKLRSLAWVACGLVLAIGGASAIGYAWNARELTTERLVPPVAINTAVVLMLLAVGILSVRGHLDPAPMARRSRLFTVEGKILLGLCGALLLMFIGGSYMYRSTVRFDTSMVEVSRIQETRATLARLYAEFSDAESAQRHYLLTGDDEQRDLYHRYVGEITRLQDRVAVLIAGEAEQASTLADLRAAMSRCLQIFELEMRRFDDGTFDSKSHLVTAGLTDPARNLTRTLVARMDSAEATIEKKLESQTIRIRQFTLAACLLTLCLATALGVLLFRAVRREIRVREEASRFDERGQRALALFTSTLSRERAIQGTLDLLGEMRPQTGVGYYGPADGHKDLQRLAASGNLDFLTREANARDGLIADAAARQRLVATPNADSPEASWPSPARTEHHLLACPVVYLEHTLGVLVLATPRALRTDERAFVRRMAGQLGVTLNNLKQYSDLLDLSDQLTGKNEALCRQAAELEQGNRIKSEFLATMSHELRTPLNAIIGFAEVLHENLAGALSEQQREYVGDILGSGEHLLELINDILDMSKVEAGKMELRLEPIDIRPVLENALTMVGERARAHRVSLLLDVDDGLPKLWLDARRLKQILFNLLGNAVKFTGDGGTVKLLATCTISGDSAMLDIAVSDNGIGISQEDQGRLFQPFVQIDSSLGKKFEGTGLGLAMVKRLALLHGGAVSVQSTPGQGSTFAVCLPCRVGPDDDIYDTIATQWRPMSGELPFALS